MAGVAGVEPTSTVLETVVLPLNYTPKRSFILTDSFEKCNSKFFIFFEALFEAASDLRLEQNNGNNLKRQEKHSELF